MFKSLENCEDCKNNSMVLPDDSKTEICFKHALQMLALLMIKKEVK